MSSCSGRIRLTAVRSPAAPGERQPYVDAFVDPEGLDIGLGSISDGGVLARFVDFAGVGPGCAVVEVGAGTGLLTFEGGLCDAAGASGEVLATDPSTPLLRVLAHKRDRFAPGRVRVSRAPAEALPVAAAQADVVCGSRFLHYCDIPLALAEMARVVRPGGTVAVMAVLPPVMARSWRRVLLPLLGGARRPSRGARRLLHRPGQVAAAFADAGLIGVQTCPQQHEAEFVDHAVTLRLVSQLSVLEVLASGLPQERRDAAVDRAYHELRAMFALHPPSERRMTLRYEFVRGRRHR
jgi:SAM-dependent methyltransferase